MTDGIRLERFFVPLCLGTSLCLLHSYDSFRTGSLYAIEQDTCMINMFLCSPSNRADKHPYKIEFDKENEGMMYIKTPQNTILQFNLTPNLKANCYSGKAFLDFKIPRNGTENPTFLVPIQIKMKGPNTVYIGKIVINYSIFS